MARTKENKVEDEDVKLDLPVEDEKVDGEEALEPTETPEPVKEKPVKATKPVVAAVKRKPHWPEGFVPSGDKRADAKILLDAAPKVSFMCPLSPEEKPGAVETVSINGYPYIIPKGQMVTIPQPVMEMLARKYRVETEVMQRLQANATAQKSQALSG